MWSFKVWNIGLGYILTKVKSFCFGFVRISCSQSVSNQFLNDPMQSVPDSNVKSIAPPPPPFPFKSVGNLNILILWMPKSTLHPYVAQIVIFSNDHFSSNSDNCRVIISIPDKRIVTCRTGYFLYDVKVSIKKQKTTRLTTFHNNLISVVFMQIGEF